MLKWFFGSIVVLLLLIVLIVVNIPASMLELGLQRVKLPPDAPKLQLSGASGTIWKGEAEDASLQLGDIFLPLGRLTWDFNLASVFEREPRLWISSVASEHQLQASISITEEGVISLRGVEGRLPIAMLESWLPLLVKGDLAFVIDHIIFTTEQLMAVDGVLNLENVSWLGGQHDMLLGSYMAQMSLNDEKNLLVQLNDFGATLGIDGNLVVSPKGAYFFKATLYPREGLAPEVAQSVGWLGREDGMGDIRISNNGRWR